MSHISTDLSMNGYKLLKESEILTVTVFNVFMLFIFILVVSLCLSSFTQPVDTYKCGCKMTCKCSGGCEYGCGCDCNTMEHFSNDKFYSYKDTVYPNYTNYQTASLTPLDESHNYGQINRYVTASEDGSKPMSVIFDIYCNLYLLNSEPFGQDSLINKSIEQSYIVYLRKNDNKKFIGKLTTDSSQIYKLKFKSDKPEDYIKFNQIDIVYTGPDGKETTIMNGRFTVG